MLDDEVKRYTSSLETGTARLIRCCASDLGHIAGYIMHSAQVEIAGVRTPRRQPPAFSGGTSHDQIRVMVSLSRGFSCFSELSNTRTRKESMTCIEWAD